MKKFFNFFKKNALTSALVGTAFFIAVVLAAFIIRWNLNQLHAIANNRFERRTDTILSEVLRQYDGSAATLRSMQGFFAGSDEVRRNEFYAFIKTSRVRSVYPGFSTFSYIPRVKAEEKQSFLSSVRADTTVKPEGYPDFAITPEGDREEYWPILYIDPEETANRLLGVDQRTENFRSENIAKARDTGDISVSAGIPLAPANKLGIILAVPLYSSKTIPKTLEERRVFFSGALSSALYADDFFGAILPLDELRNNGFGISVTGSTGTEIPIVTPLKKSRGNIEKFFGTLRLTKRMDLNGRIFDFTFTSPESAQLSRTEMFEPLLFAIIFLGAALFMGFAILVAQKMEILNDFRKRYEFISTLSHQLRTPVTVLRWGLEALDVAKNHKQEHKDLLGGAVNLNSIIERMLLYLEVTKKIDLSKIQTVSARDVYEKAVAALGGRNDLKRIIRKNSDDEKAVVNIQPDKTASALSYIIDNALTYSPKEKNISVEITAGPKMLELKVSDAGYGIPKKEQNKIFTEFFRASNAQLGENSGSGVSLFIAKKIVEAQGGTLSFTSEEGKGSVFVVRLPRASAAKKRRAK